MRQLYVKPMRRLLVTPMRRLYVIPIRRLYVTPMRRSYWTEILKPLHGWHFYAYDLFFLYNNILYCLQDRSSLESDTFLAVPA